MKLKKIFFTSSSSKEILSLINECYDNYLKKHKNKMTICLLISAEGEGRILFYSMLSRYEKNQQKEVDRLDTIVKEILG